MVQLRVFLSWRKSKGEYMAQSQRLQEQNGAAHGTMGGSLTGPFWKGKSPKNASVEFFNFYIFYNVFFAKKIS
jgi:hypothetical protein